MIESAVTSLPGIHTLFEVGCDYLHETSPDLRHAFPSAAYYAFDCDPRNIERISQSRADQALNISFHPIALCAHTGTTPFYLSTTHAADDWTFSSSMRRPRKFNEGWLHWLREPVEVACDTLDNFCAIHAISHIDLLWMDVQSAEDLVLAGASQMLASTRFIYTECNTCGVYENEPGDKGILRLLPGWKVLNHFPYDMLLENPQFTP